MGFHFVGIEIGCMLYSMQLPVAALYTRMSNTRLCELATRQRGRFGAGRIKWSTSAGKVPGILRSGKPVMRAVNLEHGIAKCACVPSRESGLVSIIGPIAATSPRRRCRGKPAAFGAGLTFRPAAARSAAIVRLPE